MDVKELFCNILKLEDTSKLFEGEFADIPILFRDPDCKAYEYAHVHIATMKNKPVLVFDLVKDELKHIITNDYEKEIIYSQSR